MLQLLACMTWLGSLVQEGSAQCCPKFISGNHSLDHYSFLVREKRFQSPETLLLNYLDVPCCGFDTRLDSAFRLTDPHPFRLAELYLTDLALRTTGN
jgi:hypothetical protein